MHPVEGRAAIVVLLVRQQAMEPGHGRGLCIVRELAASLGQARATQFTAREQPSPPHWFTTPRAGVSGPVDPTLSDRLDRLFMAAQRETAVTGLPITAHMVPAPMRLGCRRGMNSLSFSTPVIVEDIVFIETGYVCGGLCGEGRLFALQRQEGQWVPVASMGTWVS
jgi:hypothetical protein